MLELPQWALQGGAVSLLGVVFLLIVFGKLIPARFYRALEKDRDYWRAIAEKSQEHTDTLMAAARIATEITRALGGAAAPDQGEDVA